MGKIATDYTILEQVTCDPRLPVAVARKPLMVAILLKKAAFEQSQKIDHRNTVFMLDEGHDWRWHDGKLHISTQPGAVDDILVVHQTTPFAHCVMCGVLMTGEKIPTTLTCESCSKG
ncbi:hypothetical protein ACYPKM_02405 [Pseudomonas aeruginosa]